MVWRASVALSAFLSISSAPKSLCEISLSINWSVGDLFPELDTDRYRRSGFPCSQAFPIIGNMDILEVWNIWNWKVLVLADPLTIAELQALHQESKGENNDMRPTSYKQSTHE